MKHLAPFLPTKWSPSSLTVEMLHDLKSFWSDLVPLAAMIQDAKRPWSELIQASDCRVAPDSNWVIGLPEAASFSGENDFLPPRSKGPLFLCLDLTPSDTDEPLGKKKHRSEIGWPLMPVTLLRDPSPWKLWKLRHGESACDERDQKAEHKDLNSLCFFVFGACIFWTVWSW